MLFHIGVFHIRLLFTLLSQLFSQVVRSIDQFLDEFKPIVLFLKLLQLLARASNPLYL